MTEVGDEVAAGQAIGAIHFPWEPWRDPLVVHCDNNGLIYGLRRPAGTQMGQVLFMLAVAYEG